MRSSLLFVCLSGAALGLLISACGDSGGGSADNQAACVAGVEDVNALACIAGNELDPDTYCPDSLNDITIDYSEYYTCLFDQYSCDGDTYTFTDGGCAVPTE